MLRSLAGLACMRPSSSVQSGWRRLQSRPFHVGICGLRRACSKQLGRRLETALAIPGVCPTGMNFRRSTDSGVGKATALSTQRWMSTGFEVKATD